MANASNDITQATLNKGVIINLKFPHFFQFMQYPPKKIRSSKGLQYIEAETVGEADKELIKTTNRQTNWSITTFHHRFPETVTADFLGVIPEICFYNLLKLGGDLPLSSRLYSNANQINPFFSGINNPVVGQITSAFTRLSNRYRNVRSDFSSQVILIGFGYQLPILMDVIKIDMEYKSIIQNASIFDKLNKASNNPIFNLLGRSLSILEGVPRELSVELSLSEIENDLRYNEFVKGFFEIGSFLNSFSQLINILDNDVRLL